MNKNKSTKNEKRKKKKGWEEKERIHILCVGKLCIEWERENNKIIVIGWEWE